MEDAGSTTVVCVKQVTTPQGLVVAAQMGSLDAAQRCLCKISSAVPRLSSHARVCRWRSAVRYRVPLHTPVWHGSGNVLRWALCSSELQPATLQPGTEGAQARGCLRNPSGSS